MFQASMVDKIRNNPKYQELVSKRTRFGWLMAAIMLAIYFSFIMVIAFAPESLGRPLGPDSATTIGIPIGIGVIVSAFVLTGIYVYRANREFDRLTREIREEVL